MVVLTGWLQRLGQLQIPASDRIPIDLTSNLL